MTNPLIDKFYELHPEKKEKPKPDYYKGEKSYAEELEELRDTSTIPITKLISYDNESLTDGFLQIAEKLKNKEAQVYSMNIDIDHSSRTKRITFEVWDNF
jgi:hypothetical protein